MNEQFYETARVFYDRILNRTITDHSGKKQELVFSPSLKQRFTPATPADNVVFQIFHKTIDNLIEKINKSKKAHKDVILVYENSSETYVFTVYDGVSDAEASLTLKCYSDASGTYEALIALSPGNKKIKVDERTKIDSQVAKIIKFLENPDKIMKRDSARKKTKRLRKKESDRFYDF
ncbi:hypothetical protein DRJ22_01275 [Candidatus Woesearchaeota archaeon]|nr:MAG: hypothetical protein DRJ22_01275 [Candidatus Woesearchaeota archaeon]